MNIKSIMRSQDIKGIATKLSMSVEEYINKRNQDLKLCSNCKLWLEEVQFPKCKSNTDGLDSSCKKCVKITDAIYERTLKGKFISYKHGAQRRGLLFLLTKEEFDSFWQQPCSYCGSKIDTIGIDRIDNTVGYIFENCVSCCVICNVMKTDYNKKEWLSHIKKIIEYTEAQ